VIKGRQTTGALYLFIVLANFLSFECSNLVIMERCKHGVASTPILKRPRLLATPACGLPPRDPALLRPSFRTPRHLGAAPPLANHPLAPPSGQTPGLGLLGS
jgi:hypothetical protein